MARSALGSLVELVAVFDDSALAAQIVDRPYAGYLPPAGTSPAGMSFIIEAGV